MLAVLSILDMFLFKWGELQAGDRSSWGMAESSLSAGRWGGERLLRSEKLNFFMTFRWGGEIHKNAYNPSEVEKRQTYNKGAENKYWLRLLDTSRGNLGWSTNSWKRGKHWKTLHYAFSERDPKMSNFELLFLHGFSLKYHEILHKAVLTPQEYEDYFLGKKLRKKWGKKSKNLLGVFPQVKIGLKKSSRKKNFF